MVANTLSVIDVHENRLLKRLNQGESYKLPGTSLLIKLLDLSGSILLEVDPSSSLNTPVFVNDSEVIDVIQIKSGDLIKVGNASYTLVKEDQPVVIGIQRISIPESFVVRPGKKSKIMQFVSLIVFSYILLAGLYVMIDLSENEEDSCSVEEVDQTIGQLPSELKKRSKEEQLKIDEDFKAFQGNQPVLSGSSSEELKNVLKEHENKSEKSGDSSGNLRGADLEEDILSEEVTDSPETADAQAVPVSPNNDTVENPDTSHAMKEEFRDSPPREADAREHVETGIKSRIVSKSRQKPKTTHPPPTNDLLGEKFNLLVPYYRMARSGQYEALRDIGIVVEEADSLQSLSGSLKDALEEAKEVWGIGVRIATKQMIDGKEKPAARRLILYLLYRFRIYIPRQVEEVLLKYDLHLKRKYDEAVLLSPLDPTEAIKKLQHLESLVPGIHPLSKELKRELPSKSR